MVRRHRPQRNWGARVSEIVAHGLETVVLQNERLRIGVLAGKGADVVEFNFKPHDLDFVWLAAGGVRDPAAYRSTWADSLATFVDHYPGGWQEVLPNGGVATTHLGAHYGQHGEVSTLPWDHEIVADSEEEVAVRFTVRGQKSPLAVVKTLRLRAGDATVLMEETLRNESPVPFPLMWGHHLTFGRPFLTPGCRITLPTGTRVIPHPVAIHASGRRVRGDAERTWPELPGIDGGAVDLSLLPPPGTACELVYLTGFDDGWYAVEREDVGLGFRVEWDRATMPYLWYWQEFGAHRDYPWYGRHYNIGLEPFSSYPTNGVGEAVANGTALTLGPGEERRFWLRASVMLLSERA